MAITSLSGYGNSQNLMLMRNDSNADTLVAMLGSCGSHVGMQVPHSVGGLEDGSGGYGQKQPPSSYMYPGSAYMDGPTVEEGEDLDEGGDEFSHHVEKKRRLTFDQVRSLERNFEVENKLEPERKMQLAKELGLRPRQVAVWFQNRRARWKTKQLERDYEALTLDYNRLKEDLDLILREKDNLKAEVKRLAGDTESEETCKEGDSADLQPSGQCGSDSTNPGGHHPVHHDPAQLLQMKNCLIKSESKSNLGMATISNVNNNSSSSRPHVPSLDVSKDQLKVLSSDSANSSDVMDADSPRTSDSSASGQLPNANHHHHHHVGPHHHSFPPESCVGPNHTNMLHNVGSLGDQSQQQQQVFHHPRGNNNNVNATVKLEDGSLIHDSEQPCNYFLPQLDEQNVLPWWDWP